MVPENNRVGLVMQFHLMNSYLNYNFSFEVDDSDTQYNFNFIEPKPIMSHVLHVVDAVFINLTFTSELENKFE